MDRIIDILGNLQDGNYIAIIGHRNPDADSIASARIIKYFIEQIHQDKKFRFYFYFDGKISKQMQIMLDKQHINIKTKHEFDMAIAVDCASVEQMGIYQELFNSVEESMCIDHHVTNEGFGKYSFVRDKSSTASILYSIMKNEKLYISQDAAKLLYSAIITDTACFTQNLSPQTYKNAEELSRKKIDTKQIMNFFFKNNEVGKIKLLSKALNSLKFYGENSFALMTIRYNDLVRAKGEFGDTLGIIDNAINISSVKAAAIIIERSPKNFYVSLRSKGDVDVSEIATKFNGGGHVSMAAFNSEGDYKTLKRQLVRACNSHIKNIVVEEEPETINFRLPKFRK